MTFEKRIIDLDPVFIQEDTDLFENSKDGNGSFYETRLQFKNNLRNTLYTAGTGIDITSGVISALPFVSTDTLQTVYDNGLPGFKGVINLSSNDALHLISTSSAFVPPSMTTSQFSFITTKIDGMLAFANDVERYISYNNSVNSLIAYIDDIDQTSFGEMYFINNSLSTTIISPANPVKINAIYNGGFLSLFSHTSGRLTYFGELRNFKITVSLSCTLNLSSGNISVFIYKNGSQISKSKQSVYIGSTTPADKNLLCQCMIDLINGDYIEVYVQNDLATDPITVSQFNCILSSMSSL